MRKQISRFKGERQRGELVVEVVERREQGNSRTEVYK